MLEQLGIRQSLLDARGFVVQEEAQRLQVAEIDEDGREFLLTPATTAAWHSMKIAAQQDGVTLVMVSAFRSVQRQVEIVRGKLEAGQAIADILTIVAPPGYSEHHTGRAIDIGSDEDTPELEVEFETTAAFTWLTQHANAFGFSMSYPRGNSSGFQYEPWHWCHTA
ncbi:M15 family metallopeptidase [Undibacterium sp.]|uniref:M15 family metallopeptidase n=1 Tax=Undibacterium sp. TaxID=1914977 RepID=UPI002CA3CBAC|nr:M15 family metallopeptidase [Undibacterium sp.]HTD03244.1 M15 family metallopeptidase [Undibacterium sp.]